MRKHSGFTLVELAVVVVIIGVLAAFAVPRFMASVERSKAAEAFNYLSAVQAAQERYHVDGGANLPGFLGRHARGNTVAAVNLDLPVYRTPLSLFAGAGQVAADWPALKAANVMANAGITVRMPFVRLLLPLWINQPLSGKKRFDWRWQISIGGSFSI